MILVPLDSLKEGMVVAKNVDSNSIYNAQIPLLTKGTSVTKKQVENLKRHGVTAVYIEMEGTEDIVDVDVIDSTFKKDALLQMKTTFDTYLNKNASTSIKEVRKLMKIAEELTQKAIENPQVMVNLINLKNHHDSTYTHSLSVSLLSVAIAFEMKYSVNDLQNISSAALLHDIGKLNIPDAILNKPAKLTDEEFEKVKEHPTFGGNIVTKINFSVPYSIIKGVESHHEKVDGSGYPQGLTSEKIHVFAKIIAVADVFDALTSTRSYRKAATPSEAIEYIMSCAGTHFDTEIVQYFLKKVAAFPIGTIVKLSNKKTAVVVKNNPQDTLRPVVRTFSKEQQSFVDIDLLNDVDYSNITILGHAEEIKIK